MRPCSALHRAERRRSTAASSRTSSATTPSAGVMSIRTVVAPSAAKRFAVAAPIPDAAPVTTATLPSSRPMRRPPFVDALGA